MPNKFSADKHLAPQRGPDGRPRSRAQARNAGQALEALLRRQPALATRAAQASESLDLIQSVRALLPGELAAHALAASQQRGQLLITADGAVWGGRLRYALAAALPELQRQWPAVRSIRLRIGGLT